MMMLRFAASEMAPMIVTGMAMSSGQGVATTSTARNRTGSPLHIQAVMASGQGKRSKVPFEQQPIWFVTTVRDGLAVRVETYVDREEALEAAGLQE